MVTPFEPRDGWYAPRVAATSLLCPLRPAYLWFNGGSQSEVSPAPAPPRPSSTHIDVHVVRTRVPTCVDAEAAYELRML